MRKLLFTLFLGLSISVFSQMSDPLTDQFLEFIVQDEYESACAMFADEIQEKVGAVELKNLISEHVDKDGEMLIRSKLIKTFYDGHDLVYRYLWFGEQGYKFYFEIDEDKISSFFIQREAVTNNYTLPAYADEENTKIRQLLILSGDYGLSGEMMIPQGVENYPVVVFIHGSGPNDRDEGMFGNRPFRDLAYGLAANGIASLRFDKNSYLFGAFLIENKQYTIWEESGVDALNIIDYLNTQQGIPNERIFLLGHSLGGMVLPRIMDSVDVAGGIMVAGNARPLQELIYEQMLFFAKQDGDYSDGDKRRMGMLKDQIDNLKLLKEEDPADFKKPIPFGLTAWYWKDLLMYDQLETLMGVEEPILLLQGEGDYQVTMEDYKLFRKVLKKRKLPYTAISYEKVNHLLFENEGEPSAKEYERSAHVEKYIIDDMVSFIKK